MNSENQRNTEAYERIQTFNHQTKQDEVVNTITHGTGAVLAILATVLLLLRAAGSDLLAIFGAAFYGGSLILLYSASCIYHATPIERPLKRFLQKVDHCSIFVLILGTYAPITLTVLRGPMGYTVLAIVAACSVFGFILNCIDIFRFARLSMVLYVLVGWVIVLFGVPTVEALTLGGFLFILLGGVFYTAGILFYRREKTLYMHAVWHIFVLLGSLTQYLGVYFYCF